MPAGSKREGRGDVDSSGEQARECSLEVKYRVEKEMGTLSDG
jgi:hypothetical protein